MRQLYAPLLAVLRAALLVPRIVVMAANAAVGGQAVMEGVMMRGPNHWAVAMRRYNGEIVELHRTHTAYGRRHGWARLPIVRGVIALGESLVIGFKALSVSAHYAAESAMAKIDADEAAREAEKPAASGEAPAGERDSEAKAQGADVIDLQARRHGEAVAPSPTADTPETEDPDSEASPESLKGWQIALAFVFAIGFSIALFKLFPAFLTDVLFVDSKSGWFVFAEASVRISVFCLYLTLVGLMPDMRRVFQYHSAEHKAINAWENGVELTPVAVNAQSRIHVRCGTAFMLWVFVVAIGVFGAFGYYVKPSLPEVLASRVFFLPLIAGISFELIKFAGKHPNNRLLRGILAPGLWLQYLTTRQCTDDQCEVAIRSLQIVLEYEYPDATEQEALNELQDDDEAMQVMA